VTQDFKSSVSAYSISGKVTSVSGPLSGIKLSLSGPMSKTVYSNTDGSFNFGLVLPGEYNLAVLDPNMIYSFNPPVIAVAVGNSDVSLILHGYRPSPSGAY
jgi:hypothetical protein